MATVTFFLGLLACVLVNVYSIKEPNVAELAEIAEETFSNISINTCDETNTENSYVSKTFMKMLTLTVPYTFSFLLKICAINSILIIRITFRFIYCYGRLLAAVNIHNLFNDSKFFVDMPMKSNPGETSFLFY